jgi:hypothetical protein
MQVRLSNNAASSVILTGTFDDWKQSVKAERNAEGVFVAEVPVESERVLFKFVVDGEWTCGEGYPTVTDEQGNTNCYLDPVQVTPAAESKAEVVPQVAPVEETKPVKVKKTKQDPTKAKVEEKSAVAESKAAVEAVVPKEQMPKHDSAATLTDGPIAESAPKKSPRKSTLKRFSTAFSAPFKPGSPEKAEKVKAEVANAAKPAASTSGIWSKLKVFGKKSE